MSDFVKVFVVEGSTYSKRCSGIQQSVVRLLYFGGIQATEAVSMDKDRQLPAWPMADCVPSYRSRE